ncbi:hypothetical protein [Neobacillus sp. YIM B06451]|uniref:hypothetical protein n=1 Tax=Neobacillus sp. YIM B06451 TaxID=3070994 RepID=UPI002930C31F|nr:hypothetical protein [Neobacillus sp. YIM B06451]
MDSVWKADEEPEVVSVEIHYEDNWCMVHLKPVHLNTNDPAFLKDYVKMTKLHGWDSTLETD